MSDALKPALLAPHIGTSFDVLTPSGSFPIVLTNVVEYTKTATSEAFAMLFHGPQSPFMQQSIYSLRHAELGDLEIFLVPVARDKDGFEYEAVFNQML